LAIQIERPYQEGDWLNFEGRMGRVLEINWRSTQLHTLENEIIVVPNKLLTTVQVTNMSRPQRWHRRCIRIGLPYGAAPNRCKQILESATRTSGIVSNPAPFATMVDFNDHSITYNLYFYITQIERHELIEDRVRTNLWYQLKRAGLSVPFPIRNITVQHEADDREERRNQVMLEARVAALSLIPFLDPLDEYEREELATRMREDHYGVGETVTNQGELGDSLFFIQNGEVEVLVSGGESNRPRRVALLGQGDFFGELSLMTGERRSATIRTLTDAYFYVIDHHAFREVLADHPEICSQIAAILEERVSSMESKRLEIASRELIPVSSEEAENLLGRIRSFFGV
jgi:CRP-like cAMP-binding protein